MKVEKLNEERLPLFLRYCEKYKYAHDESFLYEDDLKEFGIDDENPTWLLLEGETLMGVLSLICDEYFARGRRARVRIFHCVETKEEHYKALFDHARPFEVPAEKIEMFLPDKLKETRRILESLDFGYYRTSYVMIRKGKEAPEVTLPEGFSLTPFVPGRDEEAFAEIRNIAFKNLKGSETPITIEDVKKHSTDKLLLNEGIQILRDGEKPVGLVRMIREEDETGVYSFVGPIALIPRYQGRGLGRELLKAGILIGIKNGLENSMLVVNGENEQALGLYRKTGYEIDMAVSCFTYFL